MINRISSSYIEPYLPPPKKAAIGSLAIGASAYYGGIPAVFTIIAVYSGYKLSSQCCTPPSIISSCFYSVKNLGLKILGWDKQLGELTSQAITTTTTESKVRRWDKLLEKNSHLWRCIDRIPEPDGGGFIYVFALKRKYDYLIKDVGRDLKIITVLEYKLGEMQPAFEPYGSDIRYLDPEFKRDSGGGINEKVDPTNGLENLEGNAEYVNILWKLGYKSRYNSEGILLFVPNRRALETRWEKLRKEYPKYSALKIQSSKGIATDREFIEAFPNCDALLSNGAEFLHDHFFHVIRIIFLKITSNVSKNPSYQEVKSALAKEIHDVLQCIENGQKVIDGGVQSILQEELDLVRKNLSQITAIFGLVVDSLWASADYEDLAPCDLMTRFRSKTVRFYLEETGYWKGRFGDHILKFDEIEPTLKILHNWTLKSKEISKE